MALFEYGMHLAKIVERRVEYGCAAVALYRFALVVTDHHFYIADEPSYLQLVPRLVDYVYKALQLKLLIKEEFPEVEK